VTSKSRASANLRRVKPNVLTRKILVASAVSAVAAGTVLGYAFLVRPPEIPFEMHTVDLGSSESAAFADINGDGKLDIISGENWYEAPHWTKHHFREIAFLDNYIDDLSTLPLDVNGDGHIDLITSGWFTKKLAWWENPGRTGEKMD
jgi:hypothetical protein